MVLQRYVAGDSIPTTLSPSVSLTRSGLPRIILIIFLSYHRKKIRDGNSYIVRLYMSLFSVSKLITLAPRVRRSTFQSLIEPSDLESISTVFRFRNEAQYWFGNGKLVIRYIPGVKRIPLWQGLRFVPTWKSVPSNAWYKKLLRKSGDKDGRPLRPIAKDSTQLTLSQLLLRACSPHF